jgi:hypothetical protein
MTEREMAMMLAKGQKQRRTMRAPSASQLNELRRMLTEKTDISEEEKKCVLETASKLSDAAVSLILCDMNTRNSKPASAKKAKCLQDLYMKKHGISKSFHAISDIEASREIDKLLGNKVWEEFTLADFNDEQLQELLEISEGEILTYNEPPSL